MAYIYISVPDDWPDFTVSSYYRKDGSHATHRAIDIAIHNVADRQPGSPYWFYYFQTIIWLWAAQRRGRVRFAAPPTCPHFHLDNDSAVREIGAEFISYSASRGCYLAKSDDILSYPSSRLNAMLKFIRENSHIQAYIESFKNAWLDVKTLFQSHPRYLRVHPNNQISDNDLQSKLVDMFGDGSALQRVADKTAQMVGYLNHDEAPNPLALLGLAGGAYLLYQIAKEARYWHANRPNA